MGESVQIQDSANILPERRPSTHCLKAWLDHGASLDTLEKGKNSFPSRRSSRDVGPATCIPHHTDCTFLASLTDFLYLYKNYSFKWKEVLIQCCDWQYANDPRSIPITYRDFSILRSGHTTDTSSYSMGTWDRAAGAGSWYLIYRALN